MHVHTNTHVHEHTHRNQHTHTYTHTHAQSLLPTDRVNLKCRKNVPLHQNEAQQNICCAAFWCICCAEFWCICCAAFWCNTTLPQHFRLTSFLVKKKRILGAKPKKKNCFCDAVEKGSTFALIVFLQCGTQNMWHYGWRRYLKLQVIFRKRATNYRALLRKMIHEDNVVHNTCGTTGWPRYVGCLKLQVIFRKRATNYRALLQKMTCEDKASCGSSPPCKMMLYSF